ncbi:hypothetical protein [Nitriliruptor alkaliphilus]|uniref:hypothetical protein n=1 Tax=Nitriliruptor alkaliphilus TaxID=427918 RepID=UPI0006989AB4|nr:hypothetical protein [Nitriliruptor alkaliphilus]
MSIRRAVLTATAAASLLLAGCTTSDDDGGPPEEPVAADQVPASEDTGPDEDDSNNDGSGEDGSGEAGSGEAGSGEAGTGEDGEAADEPRTFAAGEEIAVQVSWLASDDGGRRTGVFGGYRGTLTFPAHDPMTCTVGAPAEGGSMDPGTTHEVALTCPEDVTVAPGEETFTVEEGGRLVGDGLVLP